MWACYLHAWVAPLVLWTWPLARILCLNLQSPAWNSSLMSNRHLKINGAEINSWSFSTSKKKKKKNNQLLHPWSSHFHKRHHYHLAWADQAKYQILESVLSPLPLTLEKVLPTFLGNILTVPSIFYPLCFQPREAAMIAGLDFCQEPSSLFPCSLAHPFQQFLKHSQCSLKSHTVKVKVMSLAGSQHTRSHPWQGHEEEAWQARQIRTSGISKSCPCAHLKDDLCLSDACYIRPLPNFCDTGRRPSPISLQTEST